MRDAYWARHQSMHINNIFGHVLYIIALKTAALARRDDKGVTSGFLVTVDQRIIVKFVNIVLLTEVVTKCEFLPK